jgi:hypothetical protein
MKLYQSKSVLKKRGHHPIAQRKLYTMVVSPLILLFRFKKKQQKSEHIPLWQVHGSGGRGPKVFPWNSIGGYEVAPIIAS